MTKLTKDSIANFCWSFGMYFFLETRHGNFIWSDPDYGGDNTIKKFNGDLKRFLKKIDIPFARDKGQHRISSYCGEGVRIL